MERGELLWIHARQVAFTDLEAHGKGQRRHAFGLDRIEPRAGGVGDPRELPAIGVKELDAISFDAAGSLYMANRAVGLVLKFELAHPSDRFTVGLAGGVVERGEGLAPSVKLHAWKKRS